MSAEGPRPAEDNGGRRAREELAQAERWLRRDPRERAWILRGVVVALVLHAGVLFARMPSWGPDPRRVEPQAEQEMQVQFLKPQPPPPPPKVEKPKPKPQAKKIPMPDPTPTEPEPEPEPPVVETPVEAPPQPPQPTGPVRVAPGQGPGLIKRVEPEYPRPLQAARMQGAVVLDAVINKDGTVGDIKVLESANPMFEKAAVDALEQWRYTPGPYDVILTVRVNFTLK